MIDHQHARSREAELGTNAAFLRASEEIEFKAQSRKQVYDRIERLLRRQQYERQGRRGRGLLRRCIARITGLSGTRLTRLIERYPSSASSGLRDIVVIALPGATAAPMWNCWPPSTRPTTPSADRRRGAFWSASIASMASWSTSGWWAFQRSTCTIRVASRVIANVV